MAGQAVSDVVAMNIRSTRKGSGLTVADLAARCAALGEAGERLTAAAVTNIELGARKGRERRRGVTVDELLVFASALSVPASALMPSLGAVTPEPGAVFRLDGLIGELQRLRDAYAGGT